jgi:hypothetical protein
MWAHRALPLKNQLSIKDAQAVEAAFEARLGAIGEPGPALLPESEKASDHGQPQRTERAADAVTVISKPVRDRDRAHLKFVAAQPCLVCGRTPSDPHHVKFAEQRALGRKVSRFTVPICRLHHRELHRRGNERAWWDSRGIDPLPIAANLWATTHEVASAADSIEGAQRAEGNGRGLTNGSHLAGWSQNDETKPIVRPEAG